MCSDTLPIITRERLKGAKKVIERAVKVHGADLVAMGTHGGPKHAFLGNVAERTLRVAPCSVLVVHADPSRHRE